MRGVTLGSSFGQCGMDPPDPQETLSCPVLELIDSELLPCSLCACFFHQTVTKSEN